MWQPLAPPNDAPKVAGVTFARIPDYAFYIAGDDGSIWTVWSGRWHKMNPFPVDSGHLRVNCALAHNSNAKVAEYVHRLVCLAFHGPSPHKDWEVLHSDDNKFNNRADNLYWGSKKQNSADYKRNKSINEGT